MGRWGLTLQIVYETHSTSTDNEAGIATGWLPGSLSETGRALARELGARRRDDHIAVVFTSDLGRAVETARIAFSGTDIPIRRDACLRECNYGKLKGMPVAQLEAERSQRIHEPFPGGESYMDVVVRVRDFLDDVSKEWDGQRILVIGHAATRWALQHLLCGVAMEDLVNAPFARQEGWLFTLPSADHREL